MCIGDSLTEGAYFDTSHNGATIIENYPYYLAKMNKFLIYSSFSSPYL